MEFHHPTANVVAPRGQGRAIGLVVAATLAALATTQSVRAELVLQGLYSFPANPRNPSAGVVQGNDGNFYGTTTLGGANEFGTVFKLTPDGTLTTLSVFNGTNGITPSGLVQGDDGGFFGTTSRGGATYAASTSGWGTVFRISPDGIMATLVSFDGTNGGIPLAGLVQGNGGNYYGTTAYYGDCGCGTVFEITPGGQLTTLVSFNVTNGCSPRAALVQATDGSFYGTTAYGGASYQGTVFKLTPDGALTTLVSFDGANGGNPEAGLVQARDGNFYGTTTHGGATDANTGEGLGTIFKMTPDGTLTTLFSFNGTNGISSSGLVQGRDANFYGTTSEGGATYAAGFVGWGTLFRMTPDGLTTTLVSFDGSAGSNPRAGLAQGNDGSLYGTTYSGGAKAGGTVFKFGGEGALTNLFCFDAMNGVHPFANLVQGNDGSFYGATGGGGANGSYGTLFRITLSAGLTTLFSFDGTNGRSPLAGLVQGNGGSFYGCTGSGGQGYNGRVGSGYGTLYRLTSSPGLTTLVSFNGTNGSAPDGLLHGSDGNFYGSTRFGGQGYYGPAYSGYGTLFSIMPDGTLTTLFSFNGTNGRSPWAGLIQASDGNFYGTTSAGGTNYSPMLPGAGTIFKITPGGVLTTVVSFNGTNGSHPYAGLIQATDGNFYGTTYNGGADYTTPSSGSGTAFKLTPDGVLTTLVFFNGTNGSRPYAGLAQGSDGNFYGTTVLGGVNDNGTVFRLTPGGVLTTLVSFNGMNGSRPFARLVQGSDGNVYGAADGGGLGGGTIFRLVEPPAIKKIVASNGSVTLTWGSFSNGIYRVEYKPSLSVTNWLAVAPDLTATGNLSSVAHSLANVAERYYQVRLLP